MKCPKCEKDIDRVHIYSECVQEVSIDEFGNTVEYESAEVLETTIAIECPECQADLRDVIKE